MQHLEDRGGGGWGVVSVLGGMTTYIYTHTHTINLCLISSHGPSSAGTTLHETLTIKLPAHFCYVQVYKCYENAVSIYVCVSVMSREMLYACAIQEIEYIQKLVMQ